MTVTRAEGTTGVVRQTADARRLRRRVPTLIGIAAVYYVAAKLSLSLSLVGESVTPLWPPTGIAVVTMLLVGYRIWPAVTLAAFLVNLPISPSIGVAAAIAVGNTAAPAAAAGALRLVGFHPQLDRTKDAVALVGLAALAAMTISATVGSVALTTSDAVAGAAFWSTWAVWWAGDAMGVLAVAPFLFSVRAFTQAGPLPWWRAIEGIVLLAALVSVAWTITTTAQPIWVAVFPLLVLIVWRFGQTGAGVAALLVIMAASWAAAHDDGPFMGIDLLQKMVALQVFNAAVALTSFFFAAVVAERIAARLALDRSARELYLREHRIAETLQRSFLPEDLPDIPGTESAARYLPAAGDVEIGGDWYDVIALPDGSIGLAIGDVAGHGVAAAAAMGQIRMALRAYAHEALSPARVLHRLNTLMNQLQPGAMATLTYAHLDLEAGSLTLAKAGHPPPLIMTEQGARFIEGGLAAPLGVSHLVSYKEISIALEPTSTVVMYTDGLIERRGESLDDGMARLLRAASTAPGDLEEAMDHIVNMLLDEPTPDDTAILAIRLLPLTGEPFHLTGPADASRLITIRRHLGRWLRLNGVDATVGEEIVLACTEACSNVVQHAYRAGQGTVEIAASIDGGVVTLTVRDRGAWQTPRAADGSHTGRGLAVIHALMDDVEVIREATGTLVRMSRTVGAIGRHG